MISNPSPELDPGRPARYGLAIPRDILIAPHRAYALIAASAGWLPAYLLIALTGVVTTALMGPALLHVASLPQPGLAAPAVPQNAAAAASASRLLLTEVALQEIFVPLLMIGLTATALTLVARFKGLQTPYLVFVSLAANCLIPSALGSLVNAVGVRLHDPSSFHDLRSLLLAVPDNLGVFASPANPNELDFLARFDVFDVWAYVLLGYGFSAFAQIRLTTALALAFALDFIFALMF